MEMYARSKVKHRIGNNSYVYILNIYVCVFECVMCVFICVWFCMELYHIYTREHIYTYMRDGK